MTVNWWKLFLLGLLIAAIIIGILYFTYEPVRLTINYYLARAQSFLNVKVNTTDIGALIKNNLPTIAAFGATTIPLLIATVSSKMKEAAKNKELESVRKLAELDQKNASETITATQTASQKQISELQAKITALENEGSLAEAQSLLSQKNAEIQRLQTQVQDLTQLKTMTPEQVQKMIQQAQLVK